MIIHFLSGFSILSLFFAQNKWLYLGVSAIFTLLIFLSRKSTPLLNHFFNSINEKEETDYLQGPFLYAIALDYLIVYSIITGNNLIPFASMLVLVISDPFASMIGKKYGKNNYSLIKSNRTIEGSIAMFLMNALILSLMFGFGTKSIGISFILAVIEVISPSKIDDFTLPFAASLLLAIN
jgi:dolichol kinase